MRLYAQHYGNVVHGGIRVPNTKWVVLRYPVPAMAQQACARYGSTWGVGISGIAGPGGATATKPVGLVYIALSDGGRTWLRVMRPHGRYMGRAWTRQRAASHALDMLRRAMLGLLVEMEA